MSIRLSSSEIAELPKELINQLNIENKQTQYAMIEELILNNGGTASLDQLLIFIYKKTGEVKKRNTLNAMLYRMQKKGIISKVAGTKSFYKLCS